MSKTIAILIGTFFGIGYLPFIPGTFGSLAGLVLFYLLKGNATAYILVTLILIILGVLIGIKFLPTAKTAWKKNKSKKDFIFDHGQREREKS